MPIQIGGQYVVSFQTVRTLAIELHALDLCTWDLVFFSIHDDSRGLTKSTYRELLTSKVLALAIAIRTKFYQGTPHQGTEQYFENVVIQERGWESTPKPVSLKDICDKIIHADSIVQHFDSKSKESTPKPLTRLDGKRGDNEWTMVLSLSHFADCVLWWLEEIEGETPEPP